MHPVPGEMANGDLDHVMLGVLVSSNFKGKLTAKEKGHKYFQNAKEPHAALANS